MQIAGIITEYNPLHSGHVHLMEQVHRRLGPECGVICVMSGDFVQRGDFALVGKYARAEAAVRSGADLVIELSLPWAVSSAERFADGGVQTLLATGVVTHLAFGSECGDAGALMHVAQVLESRDFSHRLRARLSDGVSFAAARQAAAAELTADAALLGQPNNVLGIEYCRSILRHGADLTVLTLPREGAPHDGALVEGVHPSASAIRALVEEGKWEQALSWMAPAMAQAYRQEEEAGRAPVLGQRCERAILARLRTMTEAEYAALDEGREGLYRRLYEAGHTAAAVEQVLETAKTKRYAYARLRRMVLWAYLGLTPGDCPPAPPYLRPLAANESGRQILAEMRERARVPVLTRAGSVRRLDARAQALFVLESRAADLYSLAYPDLREAQGGRAWKDGPVMI